MKKLDRYTLPGQLPIGHWRLILRDGKPAPKVSCPRCGFEASLAGTHKVSVSGQVTPSLNCPNCTFHAHVELTGWKS